MIKGITAFVILSIKSYWGNIQRMIKLPEAAKNRYYGEGVLLPLERFLPETG
jgi:hypothetical protein